MPDDASLSKDLLAASTWVQVNKGHKPKDHFIQLNDIGLYPLPRWTPSCAAIRGGHYGSSWQYASGRRI
jgi:hypothetical protein